MAASTKTKTKTTSYDDLSDDVKALMDRAVRAARANHWCEEFSSISGPVFNVAANEVVDSDGFDCKGFNKDGFNAKGFDRNGRDKDGFSTAGFNREGYDRDGYDRMGLNKEGVDRTGRDRFRFDGNGYDQEGYDCNGERARRDRVWYAQQATRPEADFFYDRNYNARPQPSATAKLKDKLGL